MIKIYIIILFITPLLCRSQDSTFEIFKNPLLPQKLTVFTMSHNDSISTTQETVFKLSQFSKNIKTLDFELINFLFDDTILKIAQIKVDKHKDVLHNLPQFVDLENRLDKIISNVYIKSRRLDSIELKSDILNLVPSKEMIHLLIRFYSLEAIASPNYLNKLFELQTLVNRILEKIVNPIERIYGNIIAGDMFDDFVGLGTISIGYYIKARELIDLSDNITTIEKNRLQGESCSKLANFYSHWKVNYYLAKSALFHFWAANYYSLAQNLEKSSKEILLLNMTQLENQGDYGFVYEDDTFNINNSKMVALNTFKNFEHINHPPMSGLENQIILCLNAGKLCQNYGYTLEAIKYNEFALHNAILIKNVRFIRKALEELIVCFSSLNNLNNFQTAKFMLGILNITANVETSMEYNFANVRAYMSRGEIDSALNIVNNVQFNFFPKYNNNSMGWYETRRKILDYKWKIFSIINLDSAKIYKEELNNLLIYERANCQRVLEAESYSINTWLGRRVDEELILKKEIIKKRNIGIGIFIILICALIVLAVNINRKRKAEKKVSDETNKRIKAEKEIEINKINSKIRNNIHNLHSDKGILTNLISESVDSKGNETLVAFNDLYVEYSTKNYKNWETDKVTLQDAIDAIKKYLDAIKIRYTGVNYLIYVQNNLISEKIIFLPGVLDTIVNNSVFRGLRWHSFTGKVTVEISKENEYLICKVTDNGKPPSNEKAYFKNENRGLSLLKKQIENMYYEHSRNIPNEYCTAQILNNRTGTLIFLKLPYEEI